MNLHLTFRHKQVSRMVINLVDLTWIQQQHLAAQTQALDQKQSMLMSLV